MKIILFCLQGLLIPILSSSYYSSCSKGFSTICSQLVALRIEYLLPFLLARAIDRFWDDLDKKNLENYDKCSVINTFRGFCHLFSITTCGEFELQNSTDVITTTWDLLNQLNGMSLLSSGSEIL